MSDLKIYPPGQLVTLNGNEWTIKGLHPAGKHYDLERALGDQTAKTFLDIPQVNALIEAQKPK